ncbi:MAG: hypothetical protein ACLQSR_09570 [Limisphaerales bacterium]
MQNQGGQHPRQNRVFALGQLEGKSWRLSHPLIGAYRLAAQLGHDRQIWQKRLALE